MKIALTGAGGGLGRAFLSVCPPHHDVAAFTHDELDIGDHQAVMQAIVPLAPELIVNAAAFTKVDACETEPDRAYRDDAMGPHNLALASRECGAMLLHVSTDYVFDGEKGAPYDELDAPNPINIYGRAKLAGETFVRSAHPESFVVRTGYVFGGGSDYLTGALRRLADGEEAGGFVDLTGTPTSMQHLAERLLPLALTHRFGLYHLCGPEPASWFEVLTRAKALGDLPGTVIEQKVDELGLAARRPRDSSMMSLFTGELGVPSMPALDQALTELLSSL